MTTAGFIQQRPAVALLILTILVSIPFVLFPQIDIAFSSLFYAQGAGFSGASHPMLRTLRESGEVVLKLAGIVILLSVAAPMLIGRLPFLLPPRAALFLLTSLVTGPGLLVNVFFKEVWGRERPRSVIEFGGDAPFSRAWEMVDHCDSNCSFVSGEGSSSIWFVALAILVPAPWRLPAVLVALTYASALSLNRIAFGGHFLSDVLLSWTMTLTVVAILYHYFYRSGVTDEGVDAGFARIRAFLQAPFRSLFRQTR